jgi:hypothetical protein
MNAAPEHQTQKDVTPAPANPKENAPASDWDIPETGDVKRSRFHFGGASTGWAISDRFDCVLPPYKRYFGRSRRTLLIALAVLFLFLLGLIIGLAVGLTRKSK